MRGYTVPPVCFLPERHACQALMDQPHFLPQTGQLSASHGLAAQRISTTTCDKVGGDPPTRGVTTTDPIIPETHTVMQKPSVITLTSTLTNTLTMRRGETGTIQDQVQHMTILRSMSTTSTWGRRQMQLTAGSV
jgi:hypothetical protein